MHPAVQEPVIERREAPVIERRTAPIVERRVPPAIERKSVPNTNDKIQYRLLDDSEWKNATVINRAGKQSGKNKWWVNVQNEDDEASCINLQNVSEWKIGDPPPAPEINNETEVNNETEI